MPATIPTFRLLLLLTAASLLSALLPPSVHAGTYWWSGAPAPGVNGFSWSSADQPYWNPWGNGRCETRGTTIAAGNPCVLAWHVPAGLDARAGTISGTLKQANPNFEQHNFVECNGNVVLQGTATAQPFTRTWPDMCSYLSIALKTPTAATTVSAGSQFFEATGLTIELVDPSTPSLNLLSGHEGWKGAAGACIRYGFADAGSGINAVALTNLTTGQAIDAPGYANGAIVTGIGQTDRTPCMAPPGTGAYTMRVAAVDKSGNGASHDFVVSFDVAAPALGVPTVDAGTLADGRELRGTRNEYRPTFAVAASDGHSGLESIQTLLDGVVVANAASWAPSTDLAPGAHTISFRATDAVGNQSSVARSFTVIDDVAPTISIASPTDHGSSEPVLDVTAADDASGIAPTTWTVKVNGATLVASSATPRLQANVGYLVDGTHELRVSIADHAGNVATETLSYDADSGDGLPDAPGLSGLFVLQAPDRVEEGSSHHVRAIAVQDGRPVGGRFELRDGDQMLSSADAARSGMIDLDAAIATAGPLLLVPPADSDLDPVELRYEFVPKPVDPCIAAPLSIGCRDDDNDDDGGGDGDPDPRVGTNTTTIIHVPIPAPVSSPAASGGGAVPQAADVLSPYPRNVIYYINGKPYWNGLPLAESGAPGDHTPPRWKLSVRGERAGSVKRASRLALRLWTSEMSVLSIEPRGAVKRVSVNPRRKLRTIHVRIDRSSMLGRKIARARAGTMLRVTLRITATDKNENRTRPKWVTLRVRV
jgi:hypothetical protein